MGEHEGHRPLDMTGLVELAPSHHLVEPDEAAAEAEAAEAPTVPGPTKDANRYTLYVPFDHTTLSLGQASAAWIKDKGITGKTDNHVHFLVTGATSGMDNTVVTLGSPATAVSIPSHQGGLASSQIHGYAMVTSGNAWHESQHQHVVISREKDVMIRAAGHGRTVGVQADLGKVMLFGEKVVSINSSDAVKIGAHPDLNAQHPAYEGSWGQDWIQNLGAKIGSTLNTAGEVVTSALSILGAMPITITTGSHGEWNWTMGRLASVPKLLTDIALLGSTFARGAAEFASYEPAGSVGISGQKFVSLTAGIGATMYGQLASAIVSLGQAEVLGGVSALVKGLLWTEIAGGIGAALTAIGNVEVAAGHGKLEMSGEKEIAVSARNGPLVMTAQNVAQMTSVTSHACVHGAEGAYLGAGGGAGFAVQATPEGVKIGKASTAGHFETPGFGDKLIIEVNEHKVEMHHEESYVRLNKDAEIKADKIYLKSADGAIDLANGKILIGH